MVTEGLTEKQAQDRVYMFDIDGLLSTRREGGVPEHAKAFGKDIEPEKDFEAVVEKIKPSCLIGKFNSKLDQYIKLLNRYTKPVNHYSKLLNF